MITLYVFYPIMNGRLTNVTYNLYDVEGVLRRCIGGYLIVDGAYIKQPCFEDPMHNATRLEPVQWSEKLSNAHAV